MIEPTKTVPRDDTYFADGEPHGWIQWKGTDVCIDLYCRCGYHGHVDADFFYAYQCPSCKCKYIVGQHVKLIEMLPEEEDEYDEQMICPKLLN